VVIRVAVIVSVAVVDGCWIVRRLDGSHRAMFLGHEHRSSVDRQWIAEGHRCDGDTLTVIQYHSSMQYFSRVIELPCKDSEMSILYVPASGE
jgi:hypothetical protein